MRVVIAGVLLLIVPIAAAAQTAAPQAPPRTNVKVDFSLEDLSAGESTQTQTTVTLTHGVNQRSQVFFVVDSHNRFDDPDTQINAGINHVFGARRVMFSGSIGFGLDVQTIATREIDAKAEIRVARHLNPIVEFQHSKYRHDVSVAVYTIGAVLTYDRLTAQAGYQYTRASIGEEGDGIGVKASLRMTPKVSLIGNWTYGAEHAIAKTIREARRSIDQWSLLGGVQIEPRRNTSLSVAYLFQDHERLYTVKALVLSGTVGF